MADDRKITPPADPSDSFLSLPVESAGQKTEYHLEEEFRKTRKNKSPLTLLFLIFIAAGLGLGSYLLSRNVESQSEELQTNIRNFQNIQLQELLNIVNNLYAAIEQAEQDRAILEQEMIDAIAAVDENYQQRIDFLSGEEAEVAGQRASLLSTNRRVVSGLRAEYDPQFAEIDQKILDLREELSRYDSGITADSEVGGGGAKSQLRELEIRRLTESYEARIASIRSLSQEQLADKNRVLDLVEQRYNPSFSNAELQSLLLPEEATAMEAELLPSTMVHDLIGASYPQAWEYYQNSEKLLERLQQIPYKNSVAKSLQGIEWYHNELVRSYERMLQELTRQLRYMEVVEEQYQYSFSNFISQLREDGIVLDARNPEQVLIHLNAVVPVEPDQTLYVFRGEVLGAVLTLLPKNDKGFQSYARIVQQLIDDPVQPYDRILLLAETHSVTGTDPVSRNSVSEMVEESLEGNDEN